MFKFYTILLCITLTTALQAQATGLYFQIYENQSKAKKYIDDENYTEAMVYINKVKKQIEVYNKPNSVESYSAFCNLSLLEADVYVGLKKYDEGIKFIKDIRADIKAAYDMFNSDVLNFYKLLIWKESAIYDEAERYEDESTLLANFRNEIITNYNLKNKEVFDIYQMTVYFEANTHVMLQDYLQRSKFKRSEAKRILPLMKGSDDMIDFYFSTMESAIDSEATTFDYNPTKQKQTDYKAMQELNDLIAALKPYKFVDPKIKQSLLESLKDKYYDYKIDYFIKPKPDTTLSQKEIKDHQSQLEALRLEIESSPILDTDDKMDLIEDYYDGKLDNIGGYLSTKVTKQDLRDLQSNLKTLWSEIQLNSILNTDNKTTLKRNIDSEIASLDRDIATKELNEGQYQKALSAAKEKENNNPEVVNKDYLYFYDKISDTYLLLTTEMYFQFITKSNDILRELDNSDLKVKDADEYYSLKNSIHLQLYGANSQLKNYEQSLWHLDQASYFYNSQSQEHISQDFNNSLNYNYSSVYVQQKNYQKAIEYANKLFQYRTETSDTHYGSLSSIYFEMKDFEKSLEYRLKYISFLEKNSQEVGYRFSMNFSYYYLGKEYLALGKYNEAEINFKKALDGLTAETEYVYPYLDLLYAVIYADMGILYAKLNKLEKSETNMLLFAESIRTPYFESLLSVNEANRTHNESQNQHDPNSLFYYLFENTKASSKLIGYGYDFALLTKELILNTSETIRNNASINEIPELKSINKKWIKVNNELKKVNVKNRDALMDQARVLEKELILRGKPSILQLFENSKIEWTDVQANLKIGEAAIEFVSFTPYKYLKNQHEVFYGAFVLLKEAKAPVFIKLCSEAELSTIINPILAKKNNTRSTITEIYTTNNNALYNLIWRPVAEQIQKTKTIYFSPSGILHNFAFAALIDPDTKETLDIKHNLIQLGSTKDIVSLKTVGTYNKATLFGDIAYNYIPNPNDQIVANSKTRNNRGSDFKMLPGTKKEIEQIEQILKPQNITVDTYVKKSASEENLLNAVLKQPDILHISTHAFYLKPLTNQYSATAFAGEGVLKEENNPMNRSGLALAEANYYWTYGSKITENREDGILTANEIATLNLSNVKLAVMSACETALGESQSNEGVFGIQRGLKMAGVNNLLVSLWKVDDTVTQQYMVEFYTNLITNKLSIQEAYFKTQNTIKSKYPNPYDWAAFTLIH